MRSMRRPTARSSDLFARFYDGRLSVLDAPSEVAPASVFGVAIELENRGNAVWSSVSQFPVYASYHLSRRSADGDVLQSFDNVRTCLPSEIGPGQRVTLSVELTAPTEPGGYRRRDRPGSRVCHVVRCEGIRAARRDVPGVRSTTLTAEPPSLWCFLSSAYSRAGLSNFSRRHS